MRNRKTILIYNPNHMIMLNNISIKSRKILEGKKYHNMKHYNINVQTHASSPMTAQQNALVFPKLESLHPD